MSKKVLIICYTFPPATGVGGRRWSKLGTQLAKRGNTVHVITATPSTTGKYGTEKWNEITVHRIPGHYPPILTHFNKKNVLQKINYHLALNFLLVCSKGNIYDKSVMWKKTLQNAVIKLVKSENISNIIVSAPPFQHLYYITELKKKISNLNIILDFRDPWAEHPDFHKVNMSSLPLKRIEYQIHLEKNALSQADHVVAISPMITESIANFLNNGNEKFVTITNGFDRTDYEFLKSIPSPDPGYFRIVYSGSLYLNTRETNRHLVEFINKNSEVLVKNKVRFEFCGHISQGNLAFYKQTDKRIFIYHGIKPMNDALSILNQASAALFITDLGHQDIQFNTKLMDYIALRKRIFYIGQEGEVSRFIINNNIGVQFTNENLNDMLEWIINRDKFNQLSYDSFDNSLFEFSNLVGQFQKLLK